MSPVSTRARVGTARWYAEQARRALVQRNLYEDVLNEVHRDLALLQVDLQEGCSVTVAGRELERTLDQIQKVLGSAARAQGDTHVDR